MASTPSIAKGTLLLFAGALLGLLFLGIGHPAMAVIPCDEHATAPMEMTHDMAAEAAPCPMKAGANICCCTLAVSPVPPTLLVDSGMPVFGTSSSFVFAETHFNGST